MSVILLTVLGCNNKSAVNNDGQAPAAIDSAFPHLGFPLSELQSALQLHGGEHLETARLDWDEGFSRTTFTIGPNRCVVEHVGEIVTAALVDTNTADTGQFLKITGTIMRLHSRPIGGDFDSDVEWVARAFSGSELEGRDQLDTSGAVYIAAYSRLANVSSFRAIATRL